MKLRTTADPDLEVVGINPADHAMQFIHALTELKNLNSFDLVKVTSTIIALASPYIAGMLF